jgi:AmmeMemoRadiSam system protein B
MSPSEAAKVRAPAVAGQFYPADPDELRQQVVGFLAGVPAVECPAPKAVIAPHAGYIYSGPIAASAYARLTPACEGIHRIVLLGPAHYVAIPGLALPSVEAFATPLGLVPLDLAAVQRLRALAQVTVDDSAHEREHSLEVQLPFLQVILKQFTLVPLAVGEAEPGEISEVLELLWGGPETRFVISSDLSHYFEFHMAQRLDQTTAQAIEALDYKRIGTREACGSVPIRGLLQTAHRHALKAYTVDLRNSGDTAGPRDRVVGYGAFAFEEATAPRPAEAAEA